MSVNYGSHMFEVRQTDIFREWIDGLRDVAARRKIAQRVVRLEAGLFGDVKFFDGIGELRVDFGPGYRVYFVQRGRILVILLCGGDKSSQGRDIKRALELAKEV
ncbi:putative addiction module killer protein [Aminobacter aganoensis]|uniref:Putative addiction module killer protein n=2 Tax=Phyllobacteriaceae TaxID=69277 RepID=A0A7X0FBX8_9HYPH|nr:putative addiction module killer protein [Aminobacter aganoensis]